MRNLPLALIPDYHLSEWPLDYLHRRAFLLRSAPGIEARP